jgi:aminoglycoside 6'-N-acetyltransferase I
MAELSIRRDHVEGTTSTPVPYLEGWFVAEHVRNRGIGRALLEFVEAWSRFHGYTEIASDADLHKPTASASTPRSASAKSVEPFIS